MKKQVRKLAMIGAAALPLMMTGCSDEDNMPSVTDQQGNPEIEAAFDFAPRADVLVDLEYPSFAEVTIYDKVPEGPEDGNVLFKTYTGANGKFKAKITLPSNYIGKTVYAVANGYGCPSVTEAVVTKSGLKVLAGGSRAVEETENKFSRAQMASMQSGVKNALPEGKDNFDYIKKHYKSGTTDLFINGLNGAVASAKLSVTFVYSEGWNANTLYYYVYKEGDQLDMADLKSRFVKDEYKVFNAINNDPNGNPNVNQYAGKTVDLQNLEGGLDFKNGDRIGFILESEAYNTGEKEYFFTKAFDDYPDGVTQSARFAYSFVDKEDSERKTGIVYTFEDQPMYKTEVKISEEVREAKEAVEDGFLSGMRYYNRVWRRKHSGSYGDFLKWINENSSASSNTKPVYQKSDFNDYIFIVTSTPYEAIDDDQIPPLPNPPYFVENDDLSHYGMLLYEDQYPNQGDYDMNDYIVAYNMAATTYVLFDPELGTAVPPYYLGKIDYDFMPIWDGAAYGNTFSFGFTGYPETYKNDILKLESGYSMGEIKNAELASGIMDFGFKFSRDEETGAEQYVSGGINIGKDEWTFDSFDPYITVDKTGYEVHLSKKAPSQRAKTEGLDEWALNYLYKDSDFPFAMDIPTYDYEVVDETTRIDEFYPSYVQWVESNGTEATDWYLHPAQ